MLALASSSSRNCPATCRSSAWWPAWKGRHAGRLAGQPQNPRARVARQGEGPPLPGEDAEAERAKGPTRSCGRKVDGYPTQPEGCGSPQQPAAGLGEERVGSRQLCALRLGTRGAASLGGAPPLRSPAVCPAVTEPLCVSCICKTGGWGGWEGNTSYVSTLSLNSRKTSRGCWKD